MHVNTSEGRWQNILQQHTFQSNPFLGETFANWRLEVRLALPSEIGNQFWQNVNRLRVVGSASTNYVSKDLR